MLSSSFQASESPCSGPAGAPPRLPPVARPIRPVPHPEAGPGAGLSGPARRLRHGIRLGLGSAGHGTTRPRHPRILRRGRRGGATMITVPVTGDPACRCQGRVPPAAAPVSGGHGPGPVTVVTVSGCRRGSRGAAMDVLKNLSIRAWNGKFLIDEISISGRLFPTNYRPVPPACGGCRPHVRHSLCRRPTAAAPPVPGPAPAPLHLAVAHEPRRQRYRPARQQPRKLQRVAGA
jgi:hypothetical protein